MALFFLRFAIAMGVGTFISKYNTDTARIMIYNAWWFEAIMGVLLLILLRISSYQLLKKKNGPTLLLHLSWILSSGALTGILVMRDDALFEKLLRTSFIQIKHFDIICRWGI
jgi:hypothetical protein